MAVGFQLSLLALVLWPQETIRCYGSPADVCVAVGLMYLSPMFSRRGVTLVEILIAMLVFAIGGLGLAAGSASIARQVTHNAIRARAASIARTRAEQAHALPCGAISSGEERSLGVRSEWRAERGSAFTLDQTLERASAGGLRADQFLSAAPCDL